MSKKEGKSNNIKIVELEAQVAALKAELSGLAPKLTLLQSFDVKFRALRDDVNEALKDIGAPTMYGARLHAYKTEVSDMLTKHNNERKALEERVAASHDQLVEGLQQLHTGLLGAERNINSSWNTFNAFVRMMQDLLCSDKFVMTMTRESFITRLVAAGKALYVEAMEYNRAELERIKAEKASGVTPLPMRPKDPSPIEILHRQTQAQMEQARGNEDGVVIMELAKAREEAAKAAAEKDKG
jgi:hypothetical protein